MTIGMKKMPRRAILSLIRDASPSAIAIATRLTRIVVTRAKTSVKA